MQLVQLKFLKEFIKNPVATGAIYPSSHHLARIIVEPEMVAKADCVVEFGPGTGVFTKYIRKHLRQDALFFAIEKNRDLVAVLNQCYPDQIIYCDSVANIANYLRKHQAQHADLIISGLPWAIFSDELQSHLLQKTVDSLCPGGHFCTFAYLHGLLLPSGVRFARKLRRLFSSVEKTPVIWRNLPPAIVYRCVK